MSQHGSSNFCIVATLISRTGMRNQDHSVIPSKMPRIECSTDAAQVAMEEHRPMRRCFFSVEVVETITGLSSGKASMKHRENILLLHCQQHTFFHHFLDSKRGFGKTQVAVWQSCVQHLWQLPWSQINHALSPVSQLRGYLKGIYFRGN